MVLAIRITVQSLVDTSYKVSVSKSITVHHTKRSPHKWGDRRSISASRLMLRPLGFSLRVRLVISWSSLLITRSSSSGLFTAGGGVAAATSGLATCDTFTATGLWKLIGAGTIFGAGLCDLGGRVTRGLSDSLETTIDNLLLQHRI